MIVLPDHYLDKAIRLPYPAGPAMGIRRFGVLHFTAGASAKSSVEFWRTPEAKGAEAHVIIERDGTVYQIRPFNQQCDHAGPADWICPRTGKTFTYINSCSISIEFANAGDSANEDGTAFSSHKFKCPAGIIKARHKLGGPVTPWEVFPEAQLAAGEAVVIACTKRYDLDDWFGHEDCAWRLKNGVKLFDRKNDPGPAFPVGRMRTAAGLPAAVNTRR